MQNADKIKEAFRKIVNDLFDNDLTKDERLLIADKAKEAVSWWEEKQAVMRRTIECELQKSPGNSA